jgi:molybdopterin molybdotransferase
VAAAALPPFDNSSMDGYAVHAADIAAAAEEAPVTLPVADQVPAGDTRTVTVAPGTCVRIMTGALMPGGADAVVPVEWTDGDTGQARFSQPVAKGYSIRRAGDDVTVGTVLLEDGTRLGPAQIALLAASGHGKVLARPAPRVAVIATGNELTEPGAPLAPGQIWESNSYMLAAAVRQAGGVATRYRARDDPETVLALIEDLATRADLLITSGGVSMGGEHDVVKAALSGAGIAEMVFHKVAMQPGMPQGFGVAGPDRTPVLTMPGNPVSAFVSFFLFGRPALDALQGLPPRPLPARSAELTATVRSPAGRRSYLRGVLGPDGATVTPLTGQGSHQLGALARANALIVVPEQVTAMAAGETADVISLP